MKKIKYERPVLYDLANATAAGSWNCDGFGSLVNFTCWTTGYDAGNGCMDYGMGAGRSCTDGFTADVSQCVNGTRNVTKCQVGSST